MRPEQPGDAAAIAAVHRDAFAIPESSDEPVEVALVDRLRDSDAWLPEFSLVAEQDGTLVGHVLLTRAHVAAEPVLALGPIGVRPARQRAGVGAALMRSAIEAATARGEALIALLGHLDYYPRFGFVLGATLDIHPDVPEWASHFQVLPLRPDRVVPVGRFHYAQPFYDL